MRGIRLDELVDRLRAEVGHSTNAQVGQNSYDYLVQVLSRTQRRLVEEYDWAHLKVKRDIAVEAGQRYYPCPEDLHYERIIDVDFKDGTLWRPLIRGIDPTLFNIHDSDRNHQNWPVQHWDVYENLDGPTDVVGFIELWPIPNRSASAFDGMVRLTGFMQAPELIGPNDKCVLDGSLLVLYAAAEICARQNQADAQLKLTAAQQLMSRLQNQNSNKKKYVSFSPNADMQRKNPWRQRNIVGVSRNGNHGGGIPEAPADGKCYLRRDYQWVEISACISCDGGSGVNDGTVNNVTLRWDADTGEWVENLSFRANGRDSITIYDEGGVQGWNLRAFQMNGAYDPWLDETKDFSFLVVEPRGPYTSNSNHKQAVAVLADRFTVRSGDESGDPTTQSPAFRVDNEQIDIGLRDYSTNVFLNGDVFVGMSEELYGVDLPFNNDAAPGTMFAGGIAMTGSYIRGQSLEPIDGESGEQVLARAFAKDAQLNMNGNRLYGLPTPTRPDDAVNLAYFQANVGSGGDGGPADNVANGTEAGQLLSWNGIDKYVPESFVKFKSGPDRLEGQEIWVNNPPNYPQSAVNKAYIDDLIPEPTADGKLLVSDSGGWRESTNVQVRQERLHVNKGMVLTEQLDDKIGYQFLQAQYTGAFDPWTGEYINLNSLQIQPYKDPAGSGYESGVAVLGDRFTVRVPAFGDDPYDGEIAFRVRELECVLGVDSYKTNTIIQGDAFVGYDRKALPDGDNSDEKPGTLFAGGIIVGRDRAFEDASIGMEGHIIFGLGMLSTPNDTDAVNVGWVKQNAVVKKAGTNEYKVLGDLTVRDDLNVSGNVQTYGDTTLGNDWLDTHILHGDVYIGYDGTKDTLPDTDTPDTTPGTLFLGRGAKLVKDVNSPDGQDPSFNCNGFKIVGLGDPTSNDNAVTLGWARENAVVKIGDTYTLSGDLDVNGDTVLGSSNASQHVFQGDVYVGYSPNSRPDNNDTVAGTLFLERGCIVGRDRPIGTASIGMSGNVIFDLGMPAHPSHAASKCYVDTKATRMADALKTAMSESSSFEEFRASFAKHIDEVVGDD